MQPLKSLQGVVTPLPRGGYLVDTPAGYIQFGSPPETIKDTMELPNSVPQVFVLPRALFDWRKGINLAELEFPIYYNFFIRKRKTRIVCTQSQAGRLIRALQEAVFGPSELFLANDVFGSGGYLPTLASELRYFRRNIRFRDLLSLSYLRDGACTLGAVSIRTDENGDFELAFNGKLSARVPGIIECKPLYHDADRAARRAVRRRAHRAWHRPVHQRGGRRARAGPRAGRRRGVQLREPADPGGDQGDPR
jgi:hypothetical protein